jgi:multidrug resistance efflux pump
MMNINFDQKKQHQPRRDREMKVSYAPAKRKIALFRWYLILFIVASPLLYFFGKMLYLLLVVNAPGFVSLEKTVINASLSGVVEKVVAGPGDIVQPGQTLILLHDPRLDERKTILEAELQTLDTPLPPTGSNVETLLHDRIDLAREMVGYQEERLQQIRHLFEQGAATSAEINLAEAQYNKARYTYNEAQSRLSERLEDLRKDALLPTTQTEVRKKRIEAELAAIDKQRKKLAHVATDRSRVLDVFIKEGMVISPGSSMLLLGNLEHAVITCYLPPKYARYSKVGKKATVTFPNGSKIIATVQNDAGLTKRLPGDLASPIGSRDLMIVVQLVPDQAIPPMLMIDGMPVSVRFHTAVGALFQL